MSARPPLDRIFNNLAQLVKKKIYRRTILADESKDRLISQNFSLKAKTGFVFLSVLYFADMCLKASRKCFWFDELFTTYLCSLPSFKETWSAVLHGADFNPPLLYATTRISQSLFGEGLISSRLPAMVGVWLFCVCLFVFVARRAGILPGLIAGLFPFFTLVQYYAYEARAHGIVLGWCGLILVCWQRYTENRKSWAWLAGFGFCLAGALLTHVYAVYMVVPFVLAECDNLFRKERIDWRLVAAMALASVSVGSTVYLPLLRMYKATVPPTFFVPGHDSIQHLAVDVLGPSIGLLLVGIALIALEMTGRAAPKPPSMEIPRREWTVAIGFLCIPVAALIGSRLAHGPFIERYFLSSVAGAAILLGFACLREAQSRILASFMVILMIADFGLTIYLSHVNRIQVTEPSSGLKLSTDPTRPMDRYKTLLSNNGNLDILVVPTLDYFYFLKYADASVIHHLYYLDAGHFSPMLYGKLAGAVNSELRVITLAKFVATRDEFLVYVTATVQDRDLLQALGATGRRVSKVRADEAGAMYEYSK